MFSSQRHRTFSATIARAFRHDNGDRGCDSFGDLNHWWSVVAVAVAAASEKRFGMSQFTWLTNRLVNDLAWHALAWPGQYIIQNSTFYDILWQSHQLTLFLLPVKIIIINTFLTIQHFTCAKHCCHQPYMDCFIISSLLYSGMGQLSMTAYSFVCARCGKTLFSSFCVLVQLI